jgi:hypothetical protein
MNAMLQVQDHVNDQSVAVSVKVAKLTGRALAKAIDFVLNQMEKGRKKLKPGEQSMERLTRDGKDTDKIEVMGRIKSFERIARKHGIAYHAEKDVSTKPPKFTIYFKSAQKGNLTAAFKEYTAIMLGKDKVRKPSILKQLAAIKERLLNHTVDKVRNKNRGGHER